jgi:hypothetical protein
MFQGGWWNALEPSRFASMAVLSQVTDVLAKASAMERGRSFLKPGFWRKFFLVQMVLIVCAVVAVALFRPAFLKGFDPLDEVSVQEIVRKNRSGLRSESESPNVPRNFV